MALSQPALQSLFLSYEAVGVLGRGKFGAAMLLVSPTTGDMVVSKQISTHGMGPQELQTVENERHILARLHHAHVIGFLCSWSEANTLHLVMEYAEGGSLADQITAQANTGEPFPTGLVHRWIGQLCDALSHVHAQRVLHRDLKSQNVFLTSSADLKIGDFGISKVSTGLVLLKAHLIEPPPFAPLPYHPSPLIASPPLYASPHTQRKRCAISSRDSNSLFSSARQTSPLHALPFASLRDSRSCLLYYAALFSCAVSAISPLSYASIPSMNLFYSSSSEQLSYNLLAHVFLRDSPIHFPWHRPSRATPT